MEKYEKLYEKINDCSNTTAVIYQHKDYKNFIIYSDICVSFKDLKEIEEIGFNVNTIFAENNIIEVWMN